MWLVALTENSHSSSGLNDVLVPKFPVTSNKSSSMIRNTTRLAVMVNPYLVLKGLNNQTALVSN